LLRRGPGCGKTGALPAEISAGISGSEAPISQRDRGVLGVNQMKLIYFYGHSVIGWSRVLRIFQHVKIRSPLFHTAYNEFALVLSRLKGIDYLLKPVSFND